MIEIRHLIRIDDQEKFLGREEPNHEKQSSNDVDKQPSNC